MNKFVLDLILFYLSKLYDSCISSSNHFIFLYILTTISSIGIGTGSFFLNFSLINFFTE